MVKILNFSSFAFVKWTYAILICLLSVVVNMQHHLWPVLLREALETEG